jgi:hypothetical protein
MTTLAKLPGSFDSFIERRPELATRPWSEQVGAYSDEIVAASEGSCEPTVSELYPTKQGLHIVRGCRMLVVDQHREVFVRDASGQE